MGRRRWCDLPTVVLSSLRAFWEGVQGKTLTHLTLARIGDFYFSELIVPNLQELNLVSFCSAGNDPGVKQRPKHHLRRLSFDFFQADTLFSGTSLHLFVQNSMQPLESLIFKFYSNPFAGLDLFSAIKQLLGPRMNALTHLQIDCPERYYRDGTLRTFSLPALASLRTLDLRVYKDDDHTQQFLNEWVTSKLKILPCSSPFSLLDIYLHEGYFSGLLGRSRRFRYNLPGLDQEICDSRRNVQVTFLKGSKTGHSIISQALRTQTKEFVEEALPLATLNQLVKVDITTVVSLSLNLEE
ncbi:hypothetical protein DL96DRAFT_1628638 [Flagelloscypha sp. PMI_526]|nr:hypothetical protein DL96DRAFT_1628638 [Flagelloscypha sp. PMI_526]